MTDTDEKRTKHDNKRHIENAQDELDAVDTDVEAPWTKEKIKEAKEATEQAHDQMTDEAASEEAD